MEEPKYSPAGAAITDLVLEIFRINGVLLAAGDRLTKDVGLTSARWQVMGALANGPLTVAQIARNMGLQRQSVQRLVDLLGEQGVIAFEANPHHRRAKLIRMTEAGQRKYAQITRIQVRWANALSRGLTAGQLRNTTSLLRGIGVRLVKRRDTDVEIGTGG